ncbi:hypothetical protein EYC98_08740 [Halieaceae bacterium IMCC14734]|uniref:Aminoglycoside phosphotransferase domain-containing protein n=1 Tax=Candidatus Litorirhabdus singularis TaxID=2518993 RepID=A0ABT3TFC4_9GAMM|nr:phosphotransferase [Candidatus Litorirhabdus singularis]MCX2980949.1 hypothetical protein [Candidatus Litorirhabdus singularis]
MNIGLLREILPNFSFYDGRVDSFDVIPKTYQNTNAKFTIGNRSWVIKRHSKHGLSNRLLLSQWYQLNLYEAGLRVPKIEAGYGGETFIASGQEIFSIQEWIEGQTMQHKEERINQTAIRSLASHLSEMHAVSKTLYSMSPQPRNKVDRLVWPKVYLKHIKSSTRRRIPTLLLNRLKPKKSFMDRWVLENLQALEQEARQISTNPVSTFRDLCYVYSDIYWGNLIFDHNHELRAFIDFDNAGVGSQEFEIGVAASICATSSEDIHTFLNAYQEATGITLNMETIIFSMRLKILTGSLWCIHAHLDLKGVDPVWLARWSAFLERSRLNLVEFESQI